jgi:hypothetical protein
MTRGSAVPQRLLKGINSQITNWFTSSESPLIQRVKVNVVFETEKRALAPHVFIS